MSKLRVDFRSGDFCKRRLTFHVPICASTVEGKSSPALINHDIDFTFSAAANRRAPRVPVSRGYFNDEPKTLPWSRYLFHE